MMILTSSGVSFFFIDSVDNFAICRFGNFFLSFLFTISLMQVIFITVVLFDLFDNIFIFYVTLELSNGIEVGAHNNYQMNYNSSPMD